MFPAPAHDCGWHGEGGARFDENLGEFFEGADFEVDPDTSGLEGLASFDHVEGYGGIGPGDTEAGAAEHWEAAAEFFEDIEAKDCAIEGQGFRDVAGIDHCVVHRDIDRHPKQDSAMYADLRRNQYNSRMIQTDNRRDELVQAAFAYFEGLRTKDLSVIPWAPQVTLRAPLAPGGAEVPLIGRDAVCAYLSAILPAIQDVSVEEYYINSGQTAVMAKAEVTLASGAKLRVADLFEVNESGQIVNQENHFDPRPALE